MKLFFLTLVFCLCQITSVLAQCPVANSCTPGTAPASNHIFGMGIFNVSVGTGSIGFTNPTTGGSSDGYMDYSCTKLATLIEGVPAAITVSTNPNANENVRVWVDLNNNGTFEAASELVFSSVNAKVHTGTITIPVAATIIKNTILRMRVSADNFSSPLPTPCSTPVYSQVEDYGITVIPNNQKPAVNFSVPNPTVCAPTVQFQNLTQNGATSYLWNFGDNTTSTLANPSHTYATTGIYTIKLKACNVNGCDSLTKVNYISYQANGPIAASCTPATTSFCCGYGITKVTFHSLINTSQDATAGYEDFTCTRSVTVMEGQTYNMAVETSNTNNQDTWAYIDYNNNGTFETTEQVFEKLNAKNPTGAITIPWNKPYNTPLRMRIISAAQGATGAPCNSIVNGQAEDYTVIITPNTFKPVPTYTTNFTSPCDSIIQFTSTSQYQPTSYSWDFGDGSPRVFTQNPVHKYTAPGIYTIKFKACNNNGCDSVAMVNAMTITKNCLTYCPFVSTNTNFHFISNVKLNTLNHTSGREPSHFGNYTNLATPLTQGTSYPMEVTSQQGCRIYVYADFNQDGDFFDHNERFSSTNHANYKHTFNFVVPFNAKLGITRLRIISTRSCIAPSHACTPYQQSDFEVEEYSLLIQANPSTAPIAQFYTPKTNSCSFTAAFADTSAYGPTSWQWDFGDPNSGVNNTSTLQNPSHTFSAPGTYSITLTACKGLSCNTLAKTSYVTITGDIGPRTAICNSQSANFWPNGNIFIERVSLGSFIHNYIGYSNSSYNDFSCSHQITLVPGQTYPISVQKFGGSISTMNVRGWIDYNNDGTFNPATEQVFQANNGIGNPGTITPPLTAVRNKPLRFRLSGDYFLNPALEPCKQVLDGSTIDYAVILSTSNGLEEKTLSQQLKIYPNPSSGLFTLEIPEGLKGSFQLEVQDLVGKTLTKKVLLKQNSELQQLNLSFLPKGVYFLKLSDEKSAAVKKIIIE